MFESVFNIAAQPEMQKKGKKRSFESKETPKDYWVNKLKLDFAKYITKPIIEGHAKLEYPKPLSILENQKAEITGDLRSIKMMSSVEGGPTREEIYASALFLAKKLGWKEKASTKNDENLGQSQKQNEEEHEEAKMNQAQKDTIPYSPETSIPLFITNKLRADLTSFGVTDAEIDKLKPAQAWDLLQQKTLSQEIKKPEEEKMYTIHQVGEDFSVLQRMWETAYGRMESVNEDGRTNEILDLTAKTFDDPKPIEDYLESESQNLKPEEKFFIEMSIQVKKFRAKAKELLIDDEITSQNVISREDFQRFIDTNEASESVLQNIANKIMAGKQISKEEIAIYSEKAKEIEEMMQRS